MPSKAGGPYLIQAVFCERVLTEKDGVLSLIRVFDRLNVSVVAGTPNEGPVAMNAFLVLSLKNGAARGTCEITIDHEGPEGGVMPLSAFAQTVELVGDDDAGVNALVQLVVTWVPGLHWFTVKLNGVEATRIPLRLVLPSPSSAESPQ
jgi:hypothetical protein